LVAAVLAGILFTAFAPTSFAIMGAQLAVVVGTFLIAFYAPSRWRHSLPVDLSYGIYLYAFPIQQTLIAAGVRSPLALLATTVPLVVCLAWVSWHFIEKPALGLKRRFEPRSKISIESAVQAASV
jgi:peptidoglycan/LPS O-acetylase OafA/YrhL